MNIELEATATGTRIVARFGKPGWARPLPAAAVRAIAGLGFAAMHARARRSLATLRIRIEQDVEPAEDARASIQ